MRKYGKGRTVVLISFHDRICLSTRALSSTLRSGGHEVHLIFLKDDRTAIVPSFYDAADYYQFQKLDKIIGCGEDVNPITEQEINLLTRYVAQVKPDVIGISARSVAKDMATKVVSSLRKINPNATYIAGGFGPSIEPEDFLKFVDYVCIGEAERVICDFVSSTDPRNLPNIAYMDSTRTLIVNSLSDPVNLDSLPFPDWDEENKVMIEDGQIRPIREVFDVSTYDILTSRGCPSDCTYCMAGQWGSIYRKYGGRFPRYRQMSISRIISELEWAKGALSISNIRFMDSIFGVDRRLTLDLMDIYDQRIGLPFFCLLDERFTSEVLVKRLAQSGLSKSTVGIQSADQAVRKTILNRQIDNDSLLEYAWMLHRNAIQIKYDILGWNPFENDDTLRQGMLYLNRFPKGTETIVFRMRLFPGSRIYELSAQQRPVPLSTERYHYWAIIYQMILYSEETAELAFKLDARGHFQDKPDLLQEAFREVIEKGTSRPKLKLVANSELSQGSILTGTMIKEVTNDLKGICAEDKHMVLGRVLRCAVKIGQPLQWEYFYGAYGDVSRGEA